MAQTLLQIQRQIVELQREAEKLRKAEVTEVIAKIKMAMAAYDITPKDLFGGAQRKPAPIAGQRGAAAKNKSKSKLSQVAPFADTDGNEWVGRGPRPLWLRKAIAAGKSLSDFAIGSRRAKGAPGKSLRRKNRD